MNNTENKKPQIVRSVLRVKQKEYITPHYIRITLSGDGVSSFSKMTVGANNKIFVPPAGAPEDIFPDYDYSAGKWVYPSEEIRPTIRTYTHRGISLEKNEMYIDFVAHGDNGPASAWASNAKPGDILGVAMKEKHEPLYPQADWYLLVADATGIPVISAILESLPASAKGVAYIEVPGIEDQQDIQTNADVEIHWIANPHPGLEVVLPEKVKSLALPEGSRFGYIAAEFSSVKEIRQYLRKEKGWQRDEFYAFSYWKNG
ncbi:siderophore-interacting protein, partial [Pseudoxanthomonas sp. SGD-10]